MQKVINGATKTIFSAAVIVGAASLLSRVLGVVRDRILAGQFGAGDALDIYYAAFRIPDLVYSLLVMGALSAGFIPIFTKYFVAKMDEKRAWHIANSVLNILAITVIVVAAIIFMFAPDLVPYLVPGFDSDKTAQVASLTRIMMLSPILLGISSVFGGILQSLKRFFIYSLAPILYNIGIIVGAIWLSPIWGVQGLAYGVILGAAMHLLIQIIGSYSLGWKYEPIFDYKDTNVREIGRLMIPRTMSLGIAHINLVVMTVIASTLAIGSLSIFNFANNLQYFAVGVIGISYAIAAFPSLSEHAEKKDKNDLIRSFSQTARQILFFIIPATVLFLILRAQIVRVVLGAGEFGWDATIITANTLAFFTFSFFAQALIPLVSRMYFALHNTSVPFISGLVGAIINIVLALLLVQSYGVPGLALSFSIASIVQLVILWMVLRAKVGTLDEYHILRSLFIMIVAAIICASVMQKMKEVLIDAGLVTLDTFWGVFTQGLIAGSIGLFVYGFLAWMMKSPEMHAFIDGMRRKFFKKFVPSDNVDEATGI